MTAEERREATMAIPVTWTRLILRTVGSGLDGRGFFFHEETLPAKTIERLYLHLRTAMEEWLRAARCPECGHPMTGCQEGGDDVR